MISKNKISLQDWQDIKPYRNTSKTDTYYLEVANQIREQIYKQQLHIPLQDFIREEGITLFSIFITSYLEDIISGSEVWNSFVKKHKELYSSPLPFYETKNDYIEGEVNIQDVKFLIWYFINSVNKNILLNPQDSFVQTLAESLMNILETEYEYAPENDLLKSYYQIEPSENYYEVRRLLENILTRTYLFFPDTGIALLRQEDEIIQRGRNIETAINDNKDHFIHEMKTALLALSAKEWAILILGENETAKALSTMSPRIHGSFLLLGQNETHLELEHIASGKKFNLLKSSYAKHKDLKEKSIIFMGMVEWQGEWWFSGISIASDFNEEVLEREKNNQYSQQSVSFMEDQNILKDTLQKHHHAFLIYNKEVPVAFLRKEEVDDFMNGYFKFFEESLELDDEEKKKAVKKYKPKAEKSEEKPEQIMVLFHNPNAGFELYSNIESAFHIKQNTYLDKEKSDQDFFQIFLANFYSKELVNYCIEVSKKKLAFFKNNYSDGELDFFTRFFKANIYHTLPKLTIVKNN
ncbi:MAG: DUF3843 family protein [Flavobacteriaceae bacterium]|nr:DUF3843 family protein [Flavobacteriaceae bacterium]